MGPVATDNRAAAHRFAARSTGAVTGMTSDVTPATAEPVTDSRVEDWFGQSAQPDADWPTR